jgi:hypothetical protein
VGLAALTSQFPIVKLLDFDNPEALRTLAETMDKGQ